MHSYALLYRFQDKEIETKFEEKVLKGFPRHQQVTDAGFKYIGLGGGEEPAIVDALDTILKMDWDEVAYSKKKIPLNHSARLRQRTDAVNGLYLKHRGAYQRMLAIHVDSRSESQNIDVFFYHHENSKDGEQLAKNIHQTFTSKYKRYQPNREYSGNVSHRSSLYVVKYSHPPTVFIELGNIRNDKDQRRFVIADNRQALANWIYEGLLDDYSTK